MKKLLQKKNKTLNIFSTIKDGEYIRMTIFKFLDRKENFCCIEKKKIVSHPIVVLCCVVHLLVIYVMGMTLHKYFSLLCNGTPTISWIF